MDRQVIVTTGYFRDGEFRLVKRADLKAAVKRARNCKVVVRIEEEKDPISAKLRAFYWGVVIDCVSNLTGYTDREAHIEMKKLHLPIALAEVRGLARVEDLRVFDGSITDLSNQETWDYLEGIFRWCAEPPYCCAIPDPNEVVTT